MLNIFPEEMEKKKAQTNGPNGSFSSPFVASLRAPLPESVRYNESDTDPGVPTISPIRGLYVDVRNVPRDDGCNARYRIIIKSPSVLEHLHINVERDRSTPHASSVSRDEFTAVRRFSQTLWRKPCDFSFINAIIGVSIRYWDPSIPIAFRFIWSGNTCFLNG